MRHLAFCCVLLALYSSAVPQNNSTLLPVVPDIKLPQALRNSCRSCSAFCANGGFPLVTSFPPSDWSTRPFTPRDYVTIFCFCGTWQPTYREHHCKTCLGVRGSCSTWRQEKGTEKKKNSTCRRRRIRIPQLISFYLVVNKAGSSCCNLTLKETQEKTEEAQEESEATSPGATSQMLG